jgi:hypothetical protein
MRKTVSTQFGTSTGVVRITYPQRWLCEIFCYHYQVVILLAKELKVTLWCSLEH